MRKWLRVALTGASVWALTALLPFATSPAHAADENVLNSHTVQVVHNTPSNTDVLNLSLNVTNIGDTGDCEGGADDLLETGVHISLSKQSCTFRAANCPGILCAALDFDAQVNYVEHDVGSSSYGTSFGPNASGNVSSKIVAVTTPPITCGTWTINLQATGQNLSGITSPPVALYIDESDAASADGTTNCFDVNAQIGNGITKPAHGVHRARH